MNDFNLSPIATVLIFTTLNESIIEYLFGNVQPLRPYLPLVSLVVGILLAFAYQINFFALILGMQSNVSGIDILLSGFVISRGSNFLNDFVQKFLGSK